MDKHTQKWNASLVAAAAALLLTGCATTSPGTSPGVIEPGDEPISPVAEVVIPECGELLPLETVHEIYRDIAEPTEFDGDITESVVAQAGDVAATALRTEVCQWTASPSEGFIAAVFELTDADADALAGNLRASGLYAEDDVDGATVFTFPTELEGMGADTHVIVGNAWIDVLGPAPDRATNVDLAMRALESMRAANPELVP